MSENITKEEISINREKIIQLLRSTKRRGIEEVIRFLDRSGYFYLWGSHRHHRYDGGLAEHSLNVCNLSLQNNNGCDKNSIIISAILHDICKVKYHFPKDKKYLGHGSRSVDIIEDYLKFHLTDEERRAIKYHMRGSTNPPKIKEEGMKEYQKALSEDLHNLIHQSDCIDAGNYRGPFKYIAKEIMDLLNL